MTTTTNFNNFQFVKSHNIELENPSHTVSISKKDDLVAISNAKVLNVFKKEEVFESTTGTLNPIYSINHQNDVVYTKFSKSGGKLGINDLDNVLIIYDINHDCNVLFKTEPLTCK